MSPNDVPHLLGELDVAQMALQMARTSLLRARGAQRLGNPHQHFVTDAMRAMERSRAVTLQAMEKIGHE
jgi:hypothetical protein